MKETDSGEKEQWTARQVDRHEWCIYEGESCLCVGLTAVQAGHLFYAHNTSLRALQEELVAAHKKIEALEILCQGDFELVCVLAEGVGIVITASNKLPGAQWEQFHDGVTTLFRKAEAESHQSKTEQPDQWKYCPCYSYMDGGTDPDCPMHGIRAVEADTVKGQKTKI